MKTKFKPYPNYRSSKVSWLGDVPEHWNVEWLKWGLILSREKNGSTPVGQMLSVSGYRGIEEKEYANEYLMRTTEELESYRVVRKGQLVVNTMWLNYAGLGVSDFEGHVSPAYRSYSIGLKYNKRYLHHLLRSDVYVSRYKQLMYGIRPNSLQVSTDDFDHLDLLIPPQREQESIVAYLDNVTVKLDELISQKKRLVELLKEKRQALITRVVTKGLGPKAKMKDSGIVWLGQIPEHWEVKKLKIILRVKSGDMINAEEEKPEGFPIYGGNGIRGYTNKFNQLGPILLIGRVGAKCGCVHLAEGKIWVSEHALRVFLHELVDLEYLKNLLEVVDFNQLAIRTAQPLINTEIVENQFVALPLLNEQIEMGQYLRKELSKMDGLTCSIDDSMKLLQEYRAALISSAITGKIDLCDWKAS